MIVTIISLIIFLGILIFVHELGHFLAARRMDIRVEEFALGFGPKLWSRQGEETLYSLRVFPLGGFCSMTGEMPVDEEELDSEEMEIYEEAKSNQRCFFQKSPLKRLAVLAAGPLMNVILAIVAFVLIFGIYGVPVEGEREPVIGEMMPGQPAARAGIEPGDEIVAVQNEEIDNWQEIARFLQEKPGEELTFTVMREDEAKDFQVTPREDVGTIEEALGALPPQIRQRVNPFQAVYYGFVQTASVFAITVQGFVQIITEASTEDLGGPVMIASIVGQATRTGLENVLNWLAIISVNLAIINLVPFPALDGGRIVFVLIELLTGKAVPREKEGWVHMIGFFLLILLMVFIVYQDIIAFI